MTANDLAEVLAHAKARAVSTESTEALVIGADQILVCEGRIYDKPVGEKGYDLTLGRCAGGSTN